MLQPRGPKMSMAAYLQAQTLDLQSPYEALIFELEA